MLSRRARAAAALLAGACASAALVSVAPALATDGQGASSRSGGSGRATLETLSNLTTLSRWAYPQAQAAALAQPRPGARVVGHLRFVTGDGQAEVVLALRSYTAAGVTWILVPLPGRPNGLTGWVPQSALGELHVTHEHLRVNRELLQATLYLGTRAIWRAPVGVGRESLPTPAGHFYVTEKLRAIGGAFYGPYALGTSAFAPKLSEWPGGGIVGLHGTDEPQLIPGRPSHGCIRLRNEDIARLWQIVGVGTPIEIV